MKNIIEITSKPFHFRPLQEADLGEIHGIWTSDKVREYLFDNIEISIKRAAGEIRNSTRSFQQNGFGLWAAFHEAEPKMIGFTGYRRFYEPPELQLLYGLLPEYFGRGYARTFAKVMIKYGFDELGFEEIVAAADVPNKASFRVMKKAGLKYQKRVFVNGLDTISYTLNKRDYQPFEIDFHVKSKINIEGIKE